MWRLGMLVGMYIGFFPITVPVTMVLWDNFAPNTAIGSVDSNYSPNPESYGDSDGYGRFGNN